ncbi:DUF1127 domain-containing protein [Pseudoponticoccus marisrubri]|uniref:YjiS-like domain-containing protein n=1 Tax=Pseudoponticoccus marisrubri TaxID=1685382 RepID=A0A0W7WDI6_9RHOB|nr:DUF1127 domain-containing protein [Pseudoponticoccus marisrubri]KUF08689.1 hypothetical protein AVJ23_21410 [Pseudoponticoccus marisrubri]
MAYASNASAPAQSGLAARINNIVADLRARSARRKVYNQTYRELQSLSNRELADLGLSRSEIRRVAYQAAFEA